MRRISVILLLLLFVVTGVYAQNFRAAAQPDVVSVGDRFQVSFSIDVDASGFRPPRFDGFKVIMGPSTSQSVSIVNGRMSRSVSWTYVLEAQKEGNYKIPGATISYNGSEIRSNQVDVVVAKPSQAKLDQMKKEAQSERDQQKQAINIINDTKDNIIAAICEIS